ncbi:MAG: cyclic nucleotide-binding/CBS domain-containing protein [Desulfobacteraceae bacterium]|nr:cyclic nucleotide-binding/CBS domain-containing protein [Desulfobacteraceae bacterium]
MNNIDPFSFLAEGELDKIADSLSMASHPKGTVLFRQGQTHVDYLHLIWKGSAERYYEQDGKKNMFDILSEGDLYGGISILMNNGIAVRTLEVSEDAFFYLLPKALFLELCEKYEAFSEYFTDTFGKTMLNRSYSSIIARTAVPLEEDVQLFNQTVKQLYHQNPVFGGQDITIQCAAQIMSRENSSYLLIPASTDHQAGIITDSDLARKVTAQGYDIHRPVMEIMSVPLRTISDRAMVFEAMMAMIDHNIKHLPVTGPDGHIVGMLTNREMLSAQSRSPIFILREIMRAGDLGQIIEQHKRVPGLVKVFIGNGAKARNINRLITTLADAVFKKVMEFTVLQMPPPPVKFVFMIMGSEGRGEQTLKTDQDNAIIYEEPDASDAQAVKDYFLSMGTMVCDMLNQAGYNYCEGGVMAKNPKWCQPLSAWKNYFTKWINAAEPEDLLQASIFFDFKAGYGHTELINSLRDHLHKKTETWTGFFRFMTVNALHFKPPLGFFRNFVVESKGEHRNTFDIKSAMMPIVDFARIYALRHGIESTNTLDRLHHLYLRKVISQKEYEEIDNAYSFLMQLRLVRQVTALIDQKGPADNFINPKRLTRIEQTMLKEIFKRIENFQAKMKFEFTGMT